MYKTYRCTNNTGLDVVIKARTNFEARSKFAKKYGNENLRPDSPSYVTVRRELSPEEQHERLEAQVAYDVRRAQLAEIAKAGREALEAEVKKLDARRRDIIEALWEMDWKLTD